MPAARCASCDINHPVSRTHCEACGDELFQVSDPYQADYEAAVQRRRRQLAGFIPEIKDAVVIPFNGQRWVADEALERWGYEPTELGVILVLGYYYELSGRVRRGELSGWWVTPIPLEFDLQHPVLTESEYTRLDEERGLRT